MNTLNPGESWRISKISYLGHALRIGSSVGSYAHNAIELLPEGASQGLLHSNLAMYITPKIGEHLKKVQIHTYGNSFFNGGNVGIGTESPTVKLDVNGDAKVNILHLNTLNQGESWRISKISYLGHALRIGSSEGSYAHNEIELLPEGAPQGLIHSNLSMYITPKIGEHIRKVQIHTYGNSFFNGGNVGIGTDNPQKLLDVKGTIHAQNIEVDLNGWSDFVFDKDYKLPTLLEVEAHINEHNRLPDIPSEKQVKEEGINIGEMQAKLLQKIEELTLYVIDQNKKIEEQHQQIEALKSIISVK